MIKISEVLKHKGLFSQDIKTRIKNKQITVDGEVIESDVELNIEFNMQGSNDIPHVAEFIFDHVAHDRCKLILCKIVGIENLAGSNIDNWLTHLLRQHHIIKISKKDMFILKKI
jgi:hypothetical protein